MEMSLVLGGIGGQGVQTIGKMITYGANEADYYTTFLPAYGGAMRGGTSNCSVMISDEEIAAPTKHKVDCVIAMGKEALAELQDRVRPGGLLVINSSIVTELPDRDDIEVIGIPVIGIAEQCGSAKSMNVVMLGFIAQKTGVIPTEIMYNVVMDKMGKKAQFIEMNRKAFWAGVDYAKTSAEA